MNEITILRERKHLSSKEMVNAITPLYPKFDRTVLSKCEHSETYGVQMKPDAVRELYRVFGPDMVIGKKKANRKLNHQLTVRLGDTDFEMLMSQHKASGFATVQDCISALIKAYVARSKKLMERCPDHPVIRQMEIMGPEEEPDPICPVCGRECETIYKAYGEIIGCDVCIERVDASDTKECFLYKEELRND